MQCGNCSGPIELDTRFCGRCGAALPGARPSSTTGAHAAVPFDPSDLDALAELNKAKQRLTEELEAMVAGSNGRAVRDSEQRRYTDLRDRWARVSDSITEKMEVFSPRTDLDRRERLSRGDATRADPVTPPADRRARTDRRNPFPERL